MIHLSVPNQNYEASDTECSTVHPLASSVLSPISRCREQERRSGADWQAPLSAFPTLRADFPPFGPKTALPLAKLPLSSGEERFRGTDGRFISQQFCRMGISLKRSLCRSVGR